MYINSDKQKLASKNLPSKDNTVLQIKCIHCSVQILCQVNKFHKYIA